MYIIKKQTKELNLPIVIIYYIMCSFIKGKSIYKSVEAYLNYFVVVIVCIDTYFLSIFNNK